MCWRLRVAYVGFVAALQGTGEPKLATELMPPRAGGRLPVANVDTDRPKHLLNFLAKISHEM